MPQTLTWKDPACPIKIEYDPAVIESIRRLAVDGLLSLPRVGLGVGGYLLGQRRVGSVVIADFVPIACSHASGPSFMPTPGEIAEGRVLAEEKAGPSLEILGYYCSHPRVPVRITEKDLFLYWALCPGAGQFALLIRPSTTDVSRAGLFYRKSNGDLAGGTELPLEALKPEALEPETVENIETAKEDIEAAREEGGAPPVESIVALASQTPPPPPAARFFGEPEAVSFPDFAAPGFATIAPRRKLSLPLIGSVVLLAVILILLFATREHWIPRPPLELRTAETDGHFSIEWNRDAVRGLDHAVLTVIDGTAQRPIQLDSRQLKAGAFPYTRQTTQLTATLDAGSIHASATFVPPPRSLRPDGPLPDAAAKPSHP